MADNPSNAEEKASTVNNDDSGDKPKPPRRPKHEQKKEHNPKENMRCLISKPDSHAHFWPIIDEFMLSALENCKVDLVEYDETNRDAVEPLVCLGVYMSRMDSNITEALHRVNDRQDTIVVLVDDAANISKRKHDLLFYQRTEHSRFRDVAIMFKHKTHIDMTVKENIIAMEKVKHYVSNFHNVEDSQNNTDLEKTQHTDDASAIANKTTTAITDNQKEMEEIVASANFSEEEEEESKVDIPVKSEALETREASPVAEAVFPRSVCEVQIPWRKLRHTFTENGMRNFREEICRAFADLDLKQYFWYVGGHSAKEFVAISRKALTLVPRTDGEKTTFTLNGVSICMLMDKRDIQSECVGRIISMHAKDIGGVTPKGKDTNTWIGQMKSKQFEQGKHFILILTQMEERFPNITSDLKDDLFWKNPEIADFITSLSNEIGLPRQFIFPIVLGNYIMKDILILCAWDWIIKLLSSYEPNSELSVKQTGDRNVESLPDTTSANCTHL